jgi:hypothetical protein
MADTTGADDTKQYKVKVNKAVTHGRAVLTPATENIVKGKVLKLLPSAAVDSFEEV